MASSDDVGLSRSSIKCRRCAGSPLSSWDLFLPITRRGSFFQDSFFSNIHHDFDAAIREVLGRWNEPDLKVTDSRDDVSRRYRRLRSQNMNEESQAVTVTSDNTGHKEQKSTSIPVNVEETQTVSSSASGEATLRGSETSEKECQCLRCSLKNIYDKRTSQTADNALSSARSQSIDAQVIQDSSASSGAQEQMQSKQEFGVTAPRTTEAVGSESSSTVRKENRADADSRRIRRDSWDVFFPITQRGSFFQDSFFSDIHDDFDMAVRKALSRWNNTDRRVEKDLRQSDVLDRYRELRPRDLKEENLAITVTSDSTSHKAEFQQKTKIIPIEVEEEAQGAEPLPASVSMPNVPLASTTSSSKSFVSQGVVEDSETLRRQEGVKIPINEESETSFEEGQMMRQNVTQVPSGAVSESRKVVISGSDIGEASEEASVSRKSHLSFESQSTRDKAGEICTSLRSRHLGDDTQAVTSSEDERYHKEIGGSLAHESHVSALSKSSLESIGQDPTTVLTTMRNIKEQIIPLNVEDSERENVAHFGSSSVQVSDEAHRAGYTASSEDGDMFIAVVKQPDYHYKVVAQEGEGEEALGNGHLDIQATQQQRTDLGRESKTVGITSGSGYLPISRKGPFDSDYFFENVRENYSQAVREVLEKAKEWSCRSDAMQNYRSLRQRNLRLDNQAVNISEDQHSHKVVMDVHDFTGGDVTVQLVGGNELLVEGQAERQEDNKVSRLSFVRCFPLPDHVDRDAITTALSSDGILTIITRKK
ncbi:heat shock protein 21 [Penaeus vannamei]|uniref:Heat shock protein 21 n=1 Tax=Penaeus vannamei TaxID=6689 RepID=A0A3R7NN04_PENVA|nr:heat shock protein 21 [Penaeus vannamei]